MKCAIIQPSYIPWRGYFHQIQKVDAFVFYDDVQYDKHGWRNRNRVKTASGTRWLTIPVRSKGSVARGTPINEMEIDWSEPWARKHWSTIEQSYAHAPFFGRYAPILRAAYDSHPVLLCELAIGLTIELARALEITRARFLRSSELGASGDRTDRLLSVLRGIGASEYLSGPSARSYLEEEKFKRAGIGLEYMAYDYPAYEQFHPPYDPQVSIIDLLFMKGPKAGEAIWGKKQ